MDELVKELRDERNKYQTWFDTSDALDDIISDCLQAAEAIESLRAKLAKVTAERDALLLTQEEAEKNEPLTLDELREMDGKPVWIEYIGELTCPSQWGIVDEKMNKCGNTEFEFPFEDEPEDSYGKTWLAYRRKPKED